jgi:hypothetical protein
VLLLLLGSILEIVSKCSVDDACIYGIDGKAK